MNHRELVSTVAVRLGVTQISVERVLSESALVVHQTLRAGGSVAVSGIGAFYLQKREARNAKNPKTGAAVRVPAKKVPALKVSDTFTRGAV